MTCDTSGQQLIPHRANAEDNNKPSNVDLTRLPKKYLAIYVLDDYAVYLLPEARKILSEQGDILITVINGWHYRLYSRKQ